MPEVIPGDPYVLFVPLGNEDGPGAFPAPTWAPPRETWQVHASQRRKWGGDLESKRKEGKVCVLPHFSAHSDEQAWSLHASVFRYMGCGCAVRHKPSTRMRGTVHEPVPAPYQTRTTQTHGPSASHPHITCQLFMHATQPVKAPASRASVWLAQVSERLHIARAPTVPCVGMHNIQTDRLETRRIWMRVEGVRACVRSDRITMRRSVEDM
jgi:hypothetical protein